MTIITPFGGKIKIKAKGIRKTLSKNNGAVELFTYADLVIVKGKSLDILATASIINPFLSVKNDLKKTATAYYFSELIDKLTEYRVENHQMFDLFSECLEYLDKETISGPKNPDSILLSYFELNLLSYSGFSPEIEYCLHCHQKLKAEENHFSFSGGGVFCPKCKTSAKNSLPISPDILKLIRIILHHPLSSAIKIRVKEKTKTDLRQIVQIFLEYIAERRFKSAKFLANIQR